MSEAMIYDAYIETTITNDEDRYALLMSARAGDSDALERFLVVNRGLVKKCLSKIRFQYGDVVDKEDLFQEGMLGLHQAVSSYDEEKGRFSTHAMPWIYHYMQRYIENNSRTVRVPSHTNTIFTRISRFKADYFKKYGKYPDDATIMKECRVKDYEMKAYQQFGTDLISLNQSSIAPNDKDRMVGGGGAAEDKNLNDLMKLSSDPSITSPEEIFIENDTASVILRVLDTLSPMDKDIIMMRFGFEPYESEMTFDAIAKALHTTTTTVRNHMSKIFQILSVNEDMQELA